MNSNIMKQRSLSATYTFTKIYGGTKTTLTSRIKKGAGKGGVVKQLSISRVTLLKI